jgi:CDGSH-type Zn-finger protein
MNGVLKVTMLVGLAAICAGGQAPSKPDSDGVQQAIRFERTKAAAAARARAKSAANAKDNESSGNDGVQAAIRFERAKDAAAARQARLETNHPSEAATSTAAIRR